MGERIAFRMRVNAGAEEEYRRRHDEIFPELVELLVGSGISDYTIWLDPETDHLFAILTLAEGRSLDDLPNEPVMRRWWAHMADVMAVEPDDKPVQVALRPVFRLPEPDPFRIRALRVYAVRPSDEAGTYFQQGGGEHWLVDSPIANPMSAYPEYRARRSSWGINVLDSLVVEVEAANGTRGVATGSGGAPAAWLIHHHFRRFVEGADARRVNRVSDMMHRASLPYGRKGLPLMAMSAVDLALWDLLGKMRDEPVVNLIGGRVHDELELYCTGPSAGAIKGMGFWGAKVPLPYGPHEGESGLNRNVEFLAAQRAAVGPGFPLMVDCYMALDVPYMVRLAEACRGLDVHWWEEPLSPDDEDGYRLLRAAHPTLRWTTGEHEYTRYGFRRLIGERLVDAVQPDAMWVGGLTEMLRIGAHAQAYDMPVIPHGSGPYAYHFVAAQPGRPLCEVVAASADGRSVRPVFGALFDGEPMPEGGRLRLTDAPGFGMTLRDRALLAEL